MCCDQEGVLISLGKRNIKLGPGHVSWSERCTGQIIHNYSYCKSPWTHLHLAPFCTYSVSQALEETRTNHTRNFNHHKQTTIYHIACSHTGVEDYSEITGDYWRLLGDYWRLLGDYWRITGDYWRWRYTLFMLSKNWRKTWPTKHARSSKL